VLWTCELDYSHIKRLAQCVGTRVDGGCYIPANWIIRILSGLLSVWAPAWMVGVMDLRIGLFAYQAACSVCGHPRGFKCYET
jgi:hypothetical protein